MCTAVSYKGAYFGRNLDVERSYGEQVVVTPRHYPFAFRHLGRCDTHYAMVGIAAVIDGVPLYFDAVNECGLAMAGLRFAGNAKYETAGEIASFELVAWVLSNAATVKEARALLQNVRITNAAFNRSTAPSPLHWMIADSHRSVTVEQTKAGLQIFENPVGVLTNNPPFDRMLDRLPDFRGLSPADLPNTFAPALSLDVYSRGMGAIGLPGDWSSASRFVRAAFIKHHAVAQTDAEKRVQLFHTLDAVSQIKGCTMLENGDFEYTAYSVGYRFSDATCFYKIYDHSTVTAISLPHDLDGEELVCYAIHK